MILLVAFYLDEDERRQAELLECLQRNAANPWLEEIHLLIEEHMQPEELCTSYPLLAGTKFHLVPHGRRVTYQQMFSYANRCLPGRQVVLANADIYFNHTLAPLQVYDLTGKLLCLSRWDLQADGAAAFFDHPGSQDAWIFQSPLRELPCDFHMGLLGCDNRLAWEAAQAGLQVSNPGRSLQALHLHHSLVRRYSEQQRLHGPVLGVNSSYLDVPWLWFIVPCMGRLNDLRQTTATLLEQSRSSLVLVDYSCPDLSGDWARTHHPEIVVVDVSSRRQFRGAEARNRGAAVAPQDGILCFLDADVRLSPGFSTKILSDFSEGAFWVPNASGPGYDTALVCTRAAFDNCGGFDEAFMDWGAEVADLKESLRRAGLIERRFPASLLSRLGGHNGTGRAFRQVVDPVVGLEIHAAYSRVKSAVLLETGASPLPYRTRLEIYTAIQRSRLGGNEAPGAPPGAAAFRERMGYHLAQLESGVSSHTNDLRPFAAIPASLNGLQFTQVVASVVSPIEVEFLTAGKLYILVGNDWEGYGQARAWLDKRGFKENLPLVETRVGTAFEVWSLIGEAGDCWILPTQVMLVAERLVQK